MKTFFGVEVVLVMSLVLVEKSESEKLLFLPVEKCERKLNLPDGGKLLPRSTESTDQRLKTLPPLPGLAWAHLAEGVPEVKLSRKRVSSCYFGFKTP